MSSVCCLMNLPRKLQWLKYLFTDTDISRQRRLENGL